MPAEASAPRDRPSAPASPQVARHRARLLGIGQRQDERQVLQRRDRRRSGAAGAAPQRHRDDEGRADAGFALDRDAAVHRLGEAAHDREAEAGAAEAARGRTVGLHEGLEQTVALLGGEADAGVGDPDAQPTSPRRLGRRALQREADRARLGELDGIAQQVEQDLLQAQSDRRSPGRARRARRRPTAIRPLARPAAPACRPRPRSARQSRVPVCSRSRRPASILEKSRMSSMIRSSADAE